MAEGGAAACVELIDRDGAAPDVHRFHQPWVRTGELQDDHPKGGSGTGVTKLKNSKGSPPTLTVSAAGETQVTSRVGENDVQVALRSRGPADREEGFIPLEDLAQRPAHRNGDLLAGINPETWIEVVQLLRPFAKISELPATAEGGLIGLATIVPGRAEVADPARLYQVARLGDDAVLEHRLGEIDDVVGDHLGPGVGEIDDALGEIGLPAKGGVDGDRRPGATSWTISAIARASSMASGPQGGSSSTTIPAGRSPLATPAAAPPRQLKLSERAPTVTPVPSTPKVLRACPPASRHRPGS
ncbi:MAG: hypothetical protein M3461_15590 [Pseudomonadota bacterium]|nr:hypothetical protein [Pseudomonadota bacterium]